MIMKPPGPGKQFWVAAISSLAVHLIALALVSGQISMPVVQPSTSLTAVLIVPPDRPEPSSSTKTTPADSTLTPSRQNRMPVPKPVTVSASEPGNAVQVIRRQVQSPAPVGPVVEPKEDAPQPAAPIAPSETSLIAPLVPPIAWVPPKRMRLDYDVRSSLVDGQATYVWQSNMNDATYVIDGSLEASGFFATMFAGRFEQVSKGTLVSTGLKPTTFSLRRGEAQPEVARFNWDKSQIEHQRSRGEHIQPLNSNAQDLQSFIFQFGAEFLRKPDLERITFAITNARKMETYEFRVAGREKLQLPIGDVDTIHLVRMASDPADAYEAWLSPVHNHLPVKIRFMLSGRFQIEQLATKIEIDP